MNEVHRSCSDQQEEKIKKTFSDQESIFLYRTVVLAVFSLTRALVNLTEAGARKIPQKEAFLTFLPKIYLSKFQPRVFWVV